MSQEPLGHDDMESVLAARQELGSGMEPALVDSFADKIVAEVERRMEAEHKMVARREAGNGMQLALGIVSLALSIPLTAITLGVGTPYMTLVIWAGIIAVNWAFAMRRKDR